MANLTKTQIKHKLAKLIEQLECIKIDLEELQTDAEIESEEIEPYEGKDELTPQQEERQEWLEETRDTIDYQVQNLYDIIDELNGVIDE